VGYGAPVQVRELWRYPVKSLQGERIDAAAVEPVGIAGDRRLAIFDLATGYGLTARRVPELLFASAALRADGTIAITLPDGSLAVDDTALSDWLDRPVTLRSCAEQVARHYENVIDFENEAGAWRPFIGSGGAFHDSRHAAVSLVSTAALGAWDPRRFRANLVLDGGGDDDLVGTSVVVGGAGLDVAMRIGRCVMVTRGQPGAIERDLDVLRTVNRDRGGFLAVGATVGRPGVIAVGDPLTPA
jgi:uncharacterized protein YcbX